MAGNLPFLSAAMPGLSLGMAVGEENSDFAPVIQEEFDENADLFREEDELFANNRTTPAGVLAVHVFGCKDLVSTVFESNEEINVYARITVNGMRKDTETIPVIKGRVIWDEVKFFSVLMSPKPLSRLSNVSILLVGFARKQETLLGAPKHKLIGKVDIHLSRIGKNLILMDAFDIINRKQKVMGKLEIEFLFSYGHFGFGQSYQLENSLHGPEQMVKNCVYPRVEPVAETPQYRGSSSLTMGEGPLETLLNKPADTGKPIIDKNEMYPLVLQNLKSLTQRRSGLLRQTSRSKRVAYLRRMLQDSYTQISEERDDLDFKEETTPAMPSSLALMMTSPLLASAPGISKRSVKQPPPVSSSGSISPIKEENEGECNP